MMTAATKSIDGARFVSRALRSCALPLLGDRSLVFLSLQWQIRAVQGEP